MRPARRGPSQLAYSWQREGKKTRALVRKEFKNLIRLGWRFMRRARRGPSQLAYSWQREWVRRLKHCRRENFIRGLAGGSCDAPGGVPPSWPILGRESVRRLENWCRKNLIRIGWWFMRRSRRGPSQLAYSWQRERVKRLENWCRKNSIWFRARAVNISHP
jgi:hypothetical protein